MARTLTPERQKLRDEAISLRYDYGLSEPAIVAKLGIPQTTISYWVSKNLHRDGSNNSTGRPTAQPAAPSILHA